MCSKKAKPPQRCLSHADCKTCANGLHLLSRWNMNDKNPMSREEQLLRSTAQQVNPSPSFTNDLEKKLMNAHKPTKSGLFSVKKIAFATGWAIGLTALALAFIWVIRSIAPQPQPQPAAGDTPFPNGETAPESSAPQKLINYTVKEGDTCIFIADKYDTTVEEIMKHNRLTGGCRTHDRSSPQDTSQS